MFEVMMKLKLLFTISILATTVFFSCQQAEKSMNDSSYDEYPVYEGEDLGLTYTSEQSTFKLWSPPAEEVRLHLYEAGIGGEPLETLAMERGEQGVWIANFKEDLKGKFYAFQVKINGEWQNEVPDPYVKAVGVNGNRGMVIDLDETDPEGWANDQRPPLASPTDVIIYEIHFRDISVAENSGIKNKGKFLGLTETGTKSPAGESTGLDHIKEMGVTHVHILPSFDFKTIDETKLEENNYNWGYDPKNYNVPEGSYSTDPYDGAVRIREFKQMVKALHDSGIRVVLDVVYNHTGDTEASIFNQLVPGYYYRQREDGSFSDASACGNETASERPMMRKFIIESVKYWVNEYHIDGFRFDLMGIHDKETMNQVSAAVQAIDPSIIVYGEGWTASDSPLPVDQMALKATTYELNNIAAFSDDIRDAIKGHVFTHEDKGFVSGKPGLEESIKFGVVASTEHPQIDYDTINYSTAPWAKHPTQTVTYVSCHDNHTLWDRLAISAAEASEADRIKMHKLAATIVLTSQGMIFLHAGSEMLRTKNGVENSFDSPDSINQMDWSRKTKYKGMVEYFKGLIALRKNHPAFRMTTTEQLQKHLRFLEFKHPENFVGYIISDNANGDAWKEILVIFNGNPHQRELYLPEGEWSVVLDGEQINEAGIRSELGGEEEAPIMIPAISAMIFFQE